MLLLGIFGSKNFTEAFLTLVVRQLLGKAFVNQGITTSGWMQIVSEVLVLLAPGLVNAKLFDDQFDILCSWARAGVYEGLLELLFT